MTTIVLSPHLDDAVFSCGGMMAQWRRQGEKFLVLSVFTASPPAGGLFPFAEMLHDRWGLGKDPVSGRRQEDIQACESLGCGWQHLEFPDCIYRSDPITGHPIVKSVVDLFAEVQESEMSLVQQVSRRLAEFVLTDSRVLSPLGVGGHVDHRITRAAAELLNRELHYYADFPYAASYPEAVAPLIPSLAVETKVQFEMADVTEWQRAVWLYRSQISSFWESQAAMENSVTDYAQLYGDKLWTALPARRL